MNCCCDSGETNNIKVEADVGEDPIWCNICCCNLEIEEFMISNELAQELSSWAGKYGQWIDWDKDQLLPNGVEMEDEFNRRGVTLVEKLKHEVRGIYKIRFIPSKSARHYAKRGFR